MSHLSIITHTLLKLRNTQQLYFLLKVEDEVFQKNFTQHLFKLKKSTLKQIKFLYMRERERVDFICVIDNALKHNKKDTLIRDNRKKMIQM